MGAAGYGLMAGAQLGSGLLAAGAQRAQGEFERSQSYHSAAMAEIAAEEAVRHGERATHDVRRAARKIKGAQRSSYATQGVLVDSGSPADVMADTDTLSEEDIATVRNNAWREAFGYRTRATQYRMSGDYASLAARNAARSSILTGGISAATTLLSGSRSGGITWRNNTFRGGT